MPLSPKARRVKAQVVFATTVVALLLQQVGRAIGASSDLPAVQQCAACISEYLDPLDPADRDVIIHKVNRARASLTKKTHKLDIAAGLVAAIDVVADRATFKTTPGTRFDFVVQTLRENLPAFRDLAEINQQHHARFKSLFRSEIFEIGQ